MKSVEKNSGAMKITHDCSSWGSGCKNLTLEKCIGRQNIIRIYLNLPTVNSQVLLAYSHKYGNKPLLSICVYDKSIGKNVWISTEQPTDKYSIAYSTYLSKGLIVLTPINLLKREKVVEITATFEDNTIDIRRRK